MLGSVDPTTSTHTTLPSNHRTALLFWKIVIVFLNILPVAVLGSAVALIAAVAQLVNSIATKKWGTPRVFWLAQFNNLIFHVQEIVNIIALGDGNLNL